MDIKLFKETYTQAMMKIVRRYSELEEEAIIQKIRSANHHEILKTRTKIENLAEARMLLEAYDGCPYCLSPDCTSDHK